MIDPIDSGASIMSPDSDPVSSICIGNTLG
jgi:hypothetical protein